MIITNVTGLASDWVHPSTWVQECVLEPSPWQSERINKYMVNRLLCVVLA